MRRMVFPILICGALLVWPLTADGADDGYLAENPAPANTEQGGDGVCPYLGQASCPGGCPWSDASCGSWYMPVESQATEDVVQAPGSATETVAETPAPAEDNDFWYDGETGYYHAYSFNDEPTPTPATETVESTDDTYVYEDETYDDENYMPTEPPCDTCETTVEEPSALPSEGTASDEAVVEAEADAYDWGDTVEVVEEPSSSVDPYDYGYATDDWMGEESWPPPTPTAPAAPTIVEDTIGDTDADYGDEMWNEAEDADPLDDLVADETDDVDSTDAGRAAVLTFARTLDQLGTSLQNLSRHLTNLVTDDVAERPSEDDVIDR